MADLRLTPLLDAFDGPSVVDPIAPPWITPIDAQLWPTQRMKRDGPHGTLVPSGSGYPFSTHAALVRDDALLKGDRYEMWGVSSDVNDLREGHTFGMIASVGMAGQMVGYICRATSEIGGPAWNLRKYVTGGIDYVTIASVSTGPVLGAGSIGLMRRIGSTIQCWHGTSDAQTWTLKLSVSDTDYLAPPYAFYPVLGIQCDDGTGPSWSALGGGKITPQESQIIRYVSN